MNLRIAGPVGPLEGVFWLPEDGPARFASVVCHPHPGHGGTMDNTVVFRIARGLQAAGAAVLRFNFRGVGASGGVSSGDPGPGGEGGDLAAAVDWLAKHVPGVELWAAGFSFGARVVALQALVDPRIQRVVLVAPPVSIYPAEPMRGLRQPGLVVMAGADEFGTLAELELALPEWRERRELTELPFADHFFQGRTRELQERIRDHAVRYLAASR